MSYLATGTQQLFYLDKPSTYITISHKSLYSFELYAIFYILEATIRTLQIFAVVNPLQGRTGKCCLLILIILETAHGKTGVVSTYLSHYLQRASIRSARERKVWQPTETYARASGPKEFRIKRTRKIGLLASQLLGLSNYFTQKDSTVI